MGKKVKGRSFSWTTCGGPLARGKHGEGSLTAAERRAAKEALRNQEAGQKVAPPAGLPAGWTAEKHTYLSGKYKGKSYLRFASGDGKHRDVCTVSQAIRRDAADKGYDPAPALQACEAKRQADADSRKKSQKQDVEQGMTGEQRAAEAFRAKHGRLDRAAVQHLPKWSLEVYVVDERTGQKATRYKGPGGESFTMLKQVEAHFGVLIIAGADGELAASLERARAMGKEETPILKSKQRLRKAIPKTARRKSGKKRSKGSKMDVDKKKVVKKKILKKRVK